MSLIPSAGPGDIIRRDRKRADIQERRANPFPLIESTRTWLGRVSSTWTYGKPNVDLIDQDTLLPTGITVSASLPLTDNDDIQPGSDVVLNRIGSKWVIQNGYVDAPKFLRRIPVVPNPAFVQDYGGKAGDILFNTGREGYYEGNARYSPTYVTKSSSGWVIMGGMWHLVVGGSVPSGSVITTLPVGCRPASTLRFTSLVNGTLEVAPNGEVKWMGSTLTYPQIIVPNHVKFNVDAVTTPLGTLAGSWVGFGSPYGVPRYGVDGLGFGFYEGAIKSGSTTVGNTFYSGLPGALAPLLTRHVLTAAGGAWGGVYIYGSTGNLGYLAGGNTQLHLDGAMWDIGTQVPWVNAEYLNGWASYNAGSYPLAGYYLRPDGLVAIKGFVASGPVGTTIFVLPKGYRPAHRIYFDCVTSNIAYGRVDIYPDGQVVATSVSNTWVSVESTLFVPAQ